jgi:hypothetical protein
MKQPLLDEKFSAAISELIGHCEKMLAQFDMLAEKGKLCAAMDLGLKPFEAMEARQALVQLKKLQGLFRA